MERHAPMLSSIWQHNRMFDVNRSKICQPATNLYYTPNSTIDTTTAEEMPPNWIRDDFDTNMFLVVENKDSLTTSTKALGKLQSDVAPERAQRRLKPHLADDSSLKTPPINHHRRNRYEFNGPVVRNERASWDTEYYRYVWQVGEFLTQSLCQVGANETCQTLNQVDFCKSNTGPSHSNTPPCQQWTWYHHDQTSSNNDIFNFARWSHRGNLTVLAREQGQATPTAGAERSIHVRCCHGQQQQTVALMHQFGMYVGDLDVCHPALCDVIQKDNSTMTIASTNNNNLRGPLRRHTLKTGGDEESIVMLWLYTMHDLVRSTTDAPPAKVTKKAQMLILDLMRLKRAAASEYLKVDILFLGEALTTVDLSLWSDAQLLHLVQVACRRIENGNTLGTLSKSKQAEISRLASAIMDFIDE